MRADRLRAWIIGGLTASAVIHVVQPALYGVSASTLIVALFGVAYAGIMLLHVRRSRLAAPLSSILPAIGAALGILRFFLISPNAGSVIDVLLDVLLIIPLSVILWRMQVRQHDGGGRTTD